MNEICRRVWLSVLRVLTVGCALCIIICATLSESHPFELFTSFTLQYCIGSIALVFALGFERMYRWAGIAFLMATITSLQIVPYLPLHFATAAGQRESGAAAGAAVRLLFCNQHYANTHFPEFLDLVRSVVPDVIVIQELSPSWSEGLNRLKELYPFSESFPENTPAGSGVWSKYPFTPISVAKSERNFTFRELHFTLDLPSGKIALFATHPFPPVSKKGFDGRNTTMAETANLARAYSGPLLVVGDFNTTVWSPYYRKFVETSGLREARRGRSIYPTWTSRMPMPFRIPIDHAFVNDGVSMKRFEVVPIEGSDHAGFIVEVALQNPVSDLSQ